MSLLRQSLVPGTLLGGRYRVEDILGRGGSSTVYRVRDVQRTEQDVHHPAYFALKVLHDTDTREYLRFTVEGQMLQRLQHPALPRIYDVCEATSEQPAFLVLEYIAGSNLEKLRRQQPNQHFRVHEVLAFMQPVTEAIIYLHHQQPPIVHRDIKPANIIVDTRDHRAVLIDFGIAREYEADATTMAIRHCTPGYGAPEQYGGSGTGPSADIYALGATCYCLLTGTVPADALQRTTMIVSQHADPLIPVRDLVPSIPLHIAQAIEQALAIDDTRRFKDVETFWAALQGKHPVTALPVTHSLTKDTIEKDVPGSSQLTRHRFRENERGQRRLHALYVMLCVLLLALGVVGLSTALLRLASPSSLATSSQTSVVVKQPPHAPKTPRATTGDVTWYPQLAKTYTGKLENLLTHTSSTITLSEIEQNQESLRGHFTGPDIADNFTGVIDASRHILLTIPSSSKHPAFFFEGAVRPDKNLVGDYCNQDSAGQCINNYGLWSVAPA